MNKSNYRILGETCYLQAEDLLNQFGEFFPFAFGLTKQLELTPVLGFEGKDFPSIDEVINMLESALRESNKKHWFIGVAICVDVFVTPPYLKEKVEALEIRIDMLSEDGINFYIPYRRNAEGNIEFLEAFNKDPTFIFFHSK